MANTNNILGYHRVATPHVIKKSFRSIVEANPVLEKIYKAGKMQALSGTKVQIPFINARHSNAGPVDGGSNWTVNTKFAPIYNKGEFDWSQYAAPAVIVQESEWRAQDPSDFTTEVNETHAVVVSLLMRDMLNHILLGQVNNGSSTFNQFPRVGTLNGTKTALLSTGLTEGALKRTAMASQTTSYLGRTRNYDTADGVNNWFSNYAQHSGLTVDFFKKVNEIKLRSRYFANPGGLAKPSQGISLGICPLSMLASISEAATLYPGTGNSMVVLTPADLKKGEAVPNVYVINGVEYVGDYMWDFNGASSGLDPADEPCYLLDPAALAFWLQKGHDFNVGPMNDMSPMGQYLYLSFIFVSMQFAVTNPMACGLVTK